MVIRGANYNYLTVQIQYKTFCINIKLIQTLYIMLQINLTLTKDYSLQRGTF